MSPGGYGWPRKITTVRRWEPIRGCFPLSWATTSRYRDCHALALRLKHRFIVKVPLSASTSRDRHVTGSRAARGMEKPQLQLRDCS